MYSLVVLVSSLAVASASICCIPPQWEGQVGFLAGINRHTGMPQFGSGGALMVYDGVRRIIAQKETVTRSNDGQTISVDVLMDYDGDTKYIRMGTTCIKTKLNRVWYDGCIPDNATVVSSNGQFGFGANKVAINTYRLEMDTVTIMYSVTAAGCVPVIESVRGSLEGNDFMQNTGYVNITAGISNPLEIAVPPAGCENAPLVQAHYVEGMFNPGMIGRRSIFGF